MSKRYFTVAVETGSCNMPGQGRLDPVTGERETYWEECTNCGHQHKTIEAAEACRAKLRKADKRGNRSALWYNSRIHDQDGCRA